MIHSISFSNFASFKDSVRINFLVDGNAPDSDAYFTDSSGNRISKLMTVVGANASGKTNLLRSIIFLKWFINNSFSDLEPGESIDFGFKPFLFCSEDTASNLEVVFAIQDEIFRYNLRLTSKSVVSESLGVKNSSTGRWNNVFTRTQNSSLSGYEYSFSRLDVPSDFEKLVRNNSSVLSAAKQTGNSLAVKVANYFASIQSNIGVTRFSYKDSFRELMSAAEFFYKNPHLKERAQKLLRRFDLGLSDFSVNTFKDADGDSMYIPVAHHKYIDKNDGEVLLIMNQESGGTQNLLVLLKDILAALDQGDMVVFDELDNNLHPLMVPEIINLFRSNNHNPKNAQLLFSTHNAQILSELDKQQIVIVEKNEKNISEAWKLSDVEGVRADDNFSAKYLAGVYGGIPRF